MPRKIKSSGVATGDRKSSLRRSLGAPKGPRAGRRGRAHGATDGGKWAGSGSKVVERGRGPDVARQQPQPGRGAKSRATGRQPESKRPRDG